MLDEYGFINVNLICSGKNVTIKCIIMIPVRKHERPIAICFSRNLFTINNEILEEKCSKKLNMFYPATV